MRGGASIALRQSRLEKSIGVDDLIVAATSRRAGRRLDNRPGVTASRSTAHRIETADLVVVRVPITEGLINDSCPETGGVP
jgi:hypothetical protein